MTFKQQSLTIRKALLQCSKAHKILPANQGDSFSSGDEQATSILMAFLPLFQKLYFRKVQPRGSLYPFSPLLRSGSSSTSMADYESWGLITPVTACVLGCQFHGRRRKQRKQRVSTPTNTSFVELHCYSKRLNVPLPQTCSTETGCVLGKTS